LSGDIQPGDPGKNPLPSNLKSGISPPGGTGPVMAFGPGQPIDSLLLLE